MWGLCDCLMKFEYKLNSTRLRMSAYTEKDLPHHKLNIKYRPSKFCHTQMRMTKQSHLYMIKILRASEKYNYL